mmetsp:Transcript_21957/g.28437  ORF Transcript_21957/g.28437 Transcript_21957/m.28437 type:complete len:128 (+) Transcript_21957:10-393(+)
MLTSTTIKLDMITSASVLAAALDVDVNALCTAPMCTCPPSNALLMGASTLVFVETVKVVKIWDPGVCAIRVGCISCWSRCKTGSIFPSMSGHEPVCAVKIRGGVERTASIGVGFRDHEKAKRAFNHK